MKEALQIARQSVLILSYFRGCIIFFRGLIMGEDAPDIVANTFLDQITEEQMRDVGYAFLEHRECTSRHSHFRAQSLSSLTVHPTINGLLAWTCQNATGNRRDDFRALKLCDMQPYKLLHPNLETEVYCVLGLQDESKTSNRGMRTVRTYYIRCCFVSV
jgi:hypothetical protein